MEHQDTETLRRIMKAREFEPYVRHIRFPRYKNLVPNTKIDFIFPITALVGSNGTNKSSVLKALYGTPDYNNLGNYWFSTSTDPIEEVGDSLGKNCFIHGYWNSDHSKIVESLQTRVQRSDPDTWEPSRPVAKYGMETIKKDASKAGKKNATRWKAIDKKVVLIDFRQTLSAFDRFFYHGDFNNYQTLKLKRGYIRKMASHLSKVIHSGIRKYSYYGKEKIVGEENRELSVDEIEAIGKILGRKYTKIQLVNHRFFRMSGYTARLVFGDLKYTEAFAGSGEFAVVMLVTGILGAAPKSLILLDEPEVSLHPGAQQRLLDFLFQQARKCHHQFVIATHSPAMIRGLPEEAIKVFGIDPMTNQPGVIRQKALPEEAFIHIGESLPNKRTVYVEDILAREIVLRALRDHAEDMMSLIEVKVIPGGSETLISHFGPAFARSERADILLYLDGDKEPFDGEWPEPNEIPPSDDIHLEEIIKDLTGVKIQFPTDGGTESKKQQQRVEAQRQFLKWGCTYVRYLPGRIPEEFILTKLGHKDFGDPKLWFVDKVRNELRLSSSEAPSATDIYEQQKRMLAEIDEKDSELESVAEVIKMFVSGSR